MKSRAAVSFLVGFFAISIGVLFSHSAGPVPPETLAQGVYGIVAILSTVIGMISWAIAAFTVIGSVRS